MQQPQTIPSALADHIVSAALSLDAAAAFSQPPVFTVKKRNPFHNSSLLLYSSFIAPPLLANPWTAFSVIIIGQWPLSGCRSRALIAVTATRRPGNKIKNQNQMTSALKTNHSLRVELTASPAIAMSAITASFPALIFTRKVGRGLRDFHGFRTICPGFAHYTLTPDRRLTLKSGWIA